MPEHIISFVAHNDDHTIGAGGALAKYAREGCIFHTYVFSYGAYSHPHIKQHIIEKEREDESYIAEKVLGGNDLNYFGFAETKFYEEAKKHKIHKIIRDIINKYKPKKIFTHCCDDPHKDHRSVHNIVMDVVKKMKYTGSVYSFEVWNILSVKNKNKPKLVVDITKTFKTKINAMNSFKTQKVTLFSMIPAVYIRNTLAGIKYGKRYAEVFFKEK